MRWLTDQILRFIQRRCEHPGMMIAADALEGDAPGIQVRWCRRCGAISRITDEAAWMGLSVAEWRLPDPNLWRFR